MLGTKFHLLGRKEIEYLGYWFSKNGIMPLNKKVEYIRKFAPP